MSEMQPLHNDEEEDAVYDTSRAPKRVLIAGIVLTALGAAFLLVGYSGLSLLGPLNGPASGAILGLWQLVLSLIQLLAIPLGVGLISAAIVMRYVQRLFGASER